MKPKSAEYDLGKDTHGRPVTLIYRAENGVEHYELRTDAINQRDDTQRITGISLENLRAISDIIKPQNFRNEGSFVQIRGGTIK